MGPLYPDSTEQRGRLQRWGTLDPTEDGEAGDWTPGSPKRILNPTGWCFTDHRHCYQEGSRPRKY